MQIAIPGSRKAGLALLAAVVLALAVAPEAVAHAELLETSPSAATVVAEAPAQVELRFDESVDPSLGFIRVYDSRGTRVDSGDVGHPSPDRIETSIDRDLAQGTYTVAWRVLSADSDPVFGAFVFHVGAPGPQPEGIAEEVLQGTPRVSSVLSTIARFLDYCLLLLCTGGAIVLALVIPTNESRTRRRLYGALASLAGALCAVALAVFGLQGVRAAGLGVGDVLDRDVLSAVLDSRFGTLTLVRSALAGSLAIVALALARRQPSGGRGALVPVVLAAAMLVTVVSSGHASVAGVPAYVADYAHLLAAATWTGGLAFLFAALVWAKERRWDLASRAVPLFSRLAVGVVVVLIVAGGVNGYLEVRSWHGLWDTEYGVLLLTKIALVLPLLGLAALNNRVAVPRLRSGVTSARDRRRFLRTVAAELTVMLVIVAVTAVLVDAAPPRRDVAHHAAEGATLELGPFVAQLDIEPARAGENEIRLTFGHGVPPDEVDIAATLVRPNIGPFLYRARTESHGVFVARDADLPIAGPWEIRVDAARGNELFSETAAVSIGRP